MMRALLITIALGMTFGLPSVAQAHHPSWQYCEAGLRGGATAAPDYDIKSMWDALENKYRVDIVQSWPGGYSRNTVTHALTYWWAFKRGNGAVWLRRFYCSYTFTGYHDGRIDSP